MTTELIERLAREAGFEQEPHCLSGKSEFDRRITAGEYPVGESLARFAALVAEQCAQIADRAEPSAGVGHDIRAAFPMPKE